MIQYIHYDPLSYLHPCMAELAGLHWNVAEIGLPSELLAVGTEAVSLAQNLFQARLTQVCKWL